MKHSKLSLLLVVVIGAAATFYVSKDTDPPEQQPMEPIAIPFQEEFEAPQNQYLVPDVDTFLANEPSADTAPTPEPLPNLADSDPVVQRALATVVPKPDFLSHLVLKDIISRFVVSIDNLPEKSLPGRFRLLKPAPGAFTALRNGNQIQTDPANVQRYDAYIAALKSLNMRALLLTYVSLYPLFQEAYEELGYPDRYFNNRLVEVIGHLLEAPEIAYPVALVQPKVFYQYANPRYENLSSGQKMLLRLGPEYGATVRDFLQELQTQLIGLSRITAESVDKKP
ncbi:MAG: DUF3014 domain-containing protein [Gammaproteobacteria bacterium]|nr:DUF3014 domain-containing protein [Gammaproteobacteria bacterium]MDH5801661.1 DUF3014 domain-containing protein [Gammaproteobacteria bacterium]